VPDDKTIGRLIDTLPDANGSATPRVVTVRMPASLHARLQDEAWMSRTSMNRLAVAKLMLAADMIDEAVKELPKEPPE